MPFAIIPLAFQMVKGWLTLALNLWNALPPAVKVAVMICFALALGYWRGGAIERARCDARVAASIEAAKALDLKTSEEARIRRAPQLTEESARSITDAEELKRYADEIAKRVAEKCGIGPDADRVNDGLGLQPDESGIPAARPPAARGRGDRAKPSPVPPRRPE